MQRKKNMIEIIKFVYVTILFISLFYVVSESLCKPLSHHSQILFSTLYTIFDQFTCIIFIFLDNHYFVLNHSYS